MIQRMNDHCLNVQPNSSNLTTKYNQKTDNPIGSQLELRFILFLVAGSVNIVANLPLLVFLLYNHKKLLKRHTTKYFINIQAIHIIGGMKIIFTTTFFNCPSNIAVALSKILMTEMILSMLMLNCDRYFAISKPFVYQKMTSKKACLLIAASWMIMLVEFVLFIVLNLRRQVVLNVILTILMIISITVLTYSNIVIWFIARKHIDSIAQNSVNEHTRERNRRKHLKKSTVSCLVVIGSFIVLYTPSLIHNVMEAWFRSTLSDAFTTSFIVIALMNGIVDPLIYVMFNSEIKSEIVNSLPVLKKKKVHSKNST